MKDLAPWIVLACMLILVPTVVAFGQQTAKGTFSPPANVQNAVTHNALGLAKEKKGDLDV
jgi:hypothetical protein